MQTGSTMRTRLSLVPGLVLGLVLVQGSLAQISLTQSPRSRIFAPGDDVSIRCKASANVFHWLNWYRQRPGHKIQLVISRASSLKPGVPDRFSGAGSGTDFTLRIRGAQPEDSGFYFCQQSNGDL
ncbi:unnamed protein product [Ophioblennius macclurei]